MIKTEYGQKVKYKYIGKQYITLRNVTKIEYDTKGVHFYSKIHEQGVMLPKKHYTGDVLEEIIMFPETTILKKFI